METKVPDLLSNQWGQEKDIRASCVMGMWKKEKGGLDPRQKVVFGCVV